MAKKKGWLSNNIANILDIVMVVGTVYLGYYILTSGLPINKDNKEIIFYILGALISITTGIFNYHRGSSKSSEDKTELIDKYMENPVYKPQNKKCKDCDDYEDNDMGEIDGF